MRMLDLFCGRFGWGKAFAARGWDVVGIDLVEPPEIPRGCRFYELDILSINRVQGWMRDWDFDFICASSPCEQFSVNGMKHFHPNPPYPELGIKLFNHARSLCEASGVPYVMENVRAAQQFVGNAVNHCGPFYLWGSGVPPLMPQGIQKGTTKIHGSLKPNERSLPKEQKYALRMHRFGNEDGSSYTISAKKRAAQTATIPPELANCVADYAERICETRDVSVA
jgi:hypothetical protein